MRTRANTIFSRSLLTILLTSLLVSCGGDNSSGSSGSSSSGTTVVTSGNGSSVPSNWRTVVMNEYACTSGQYGVTGTNRTRVNITSPTSSTIDEGGLHVGVTVAGDVLVMSRSGNVITTELYVCQRSTYTSYMPTAQFKTTPVVDTSDYCGVGQVSAANIYLTAAYGTYELAFFPIGRSKSSSLCTNGYNYYSY